MSTRVLHCQRIARPPHGRDPRPSHACSRRSHGRLTWLGRRDWRMDYRDPHGASTPPRERDVRAPAARRPAPRGYPSAGSSPSPRLCAKTSPPAPTATASPQPSRSRCYRRPTRDREPSRQTDAPADSARPQSRVGCPCSEDRGAWHVARPPPPCASTAVPARGPRATRPPGVVGPGDDDHNGDVFPRQAL